MQDSVKGSCLAHGHSNICDSAGNLLLLCDGMNLYNAALDTLEDGGRLVDSAWYADNFGYSVQAQTSIILPFQNGKYYLVNSYFSDTQFVFWPPRNYEDRLAYHVVDMNANGGAGKVVRRKVQMVTPGTPLSVVQMTACRHANGRDWWLVKQGFDSNVVYKFLFQQDTVLGPFIQRFPAPRFTNLNHNGQSCFTADGTRYATTCRGAGKVFVADFDRCSGMLTNPLVYNMPVTSIHSPSVPTSTEYFSESCQFSPNGRFLYVGQFYNVHQLDLQDNVAATQWAHVAGLDTTFDAFMNYSTIYPGPDGKLYVGNWNALSGQMSYFATPDVKGAGCGFTPRGLRFPLIYNAQGNPYYVATDPPNMPNYALGATNPPCGLGVEEVVASPQIKVYPNPTNGIVTVETAQAKGSVEVYNLLGQQVLREVLSGFSTTLNLSRNAAGVYYYRWVVEGKAVQSGKLVLAP